MAKAYAYVTDSAKTLHVCIFYTSSQKHLPSPKSSTDFSFIVPK